MSNSLRALAQKAKNRLKSMQENSNNIYQSENKTKEYGEACLSARLQYAIIASQRKVQDDPLYNKVKKMLIKDIDVMNPLAQLIEHNIYDNLDEIQKEKYIYKLSKRYVEMREHILKDLTNNPQEQEASQN